jgi:thiamine-phosphate pyrophosphorylase
MRPVICMVSSPARSEAAEARLIERVIAAAAAGVHLIQIRDRHLDGGPLARLVARCVEGVGATATRVIVNDRLDVALAAGAHGVHLRGHSMPASRVRAIVPRGFVVGRSVRGVDEAQRAAAGGGLDYLIFGTVFATASKPGVAAAGSRALAKVVASTSLPVLAIGGVSLETAGQLGASGAAGVAAIGLFAAANCEALHQTIAQLSLAFNRLEP